MKLVRREKSNSNNKYEEEMKQMFEEGGLGDELIETAILERRYATQFTKR